MSQPDHIVVGAGIAGLTFAWKAARAGKQVLVLERDERVGGCIHSHRSEDGHWFELGAHTTYNSYGGFLALAEDAGAGSLLVPRGPAAKRFGFLRDGLTYTLTPLTVLLQFRWFEMAWAALFGVWRSKAGLSMAEYFGGLVGRRNYAEVLSHFLAAVPSQRADAFPAEGPGSLFKKRPRRDDIPRSFGFTGGLQEVCDAAAKIPGITVRTGVEVAEVRALSGGYDVVTTAGEHITAAHVTVATPCNVAARVLKRAFPALADAIAQVGTVQVESVGVRVPQDHTHVEPMAFIVPSHDIYYSAVTRDPFPDERWRSFAFHFHPGQGERAQDERITSLIGHPVEPLVRKTISLPSPRVGHQALVRRVDQALEATGLTLTGNYFDGLAIEDCVQRSLAEWARLNALIS